NRRKQAKRKQAHARGDWLQRRSRGNGLLGRQLNREAQSGIQRTGMIATLTFNSTVPSVDVQATT
ncbi:MAG: hypothetical protein GY914_11230, partial [Prochlorococcus sp.]|nr:hypothetical protein [Prochlorococcus sp.]